MAQAKVMQRPIFTSGSFCASDAGTQAGLLQSLWYQLRSWAGFSAVNELLLQSSSMQGVHSETVGGVKSIAIIGAGPTGLAFAKYLDAENHFTKIDVFERRSALGGIWNTDGRSAKCDVGNFPSPIYDIMESNIPKPVMQYSSFHFTENCPILPDAETVQGYLERYGEEVKRLVHLRTEVVSVKSYDVDDLEGQPWEVTVRSLDTSETATSIYDAVVVANGRYNAPYWPAIIGLDEYRKHNPGSVLHSLDFRSADDFRGKKVLIVGYSSSGVDIALQLEKVCRQPLLISQKSANGLSPGSSAFAEGKTMLPQIIDLDAKTRTAKFADGQTECDIDIIMLCTGYEYEHPFLQVMDEFKGPAEHSNSDTYLHMFWNPRPTIAFGLLPLRVVAFPFAESQAAAIARVWSGRLELPSRQDRDRWTAMNAATRGSGKSFHKLSYPADADYMNELYDWCLKARNASTQGKLPPFWGDKERWLRRKVHDIRRATEAKGEERVSVTKIEDIGFVYKPEP